MGNKIASVVVTGWSNQPVTYLNPLSFEICDGIVKIGVASTSSTPRVVDHYPVNALKFFQIVLGAD